MPLPFNCKDDLVCVLLNPTFIPLVMTIFLYGIYTIMFLISVYFLVNHQKIGLKFYLITLCITFLLATANAVLSAPWEMLSYAIAFSSSSATNYYCDLFKSIQGASKIIYIVSNCITDIVLMFRCYLVWASNKKLLVLLVIGSIGNNAFALFASIFFLIKSGPEDVIYKSASMSSMSKDVFDYPRIWFLYINSSVNLVISGLIAGRIWYINHKAQRILPSTISKRYKSVIFIVLESGSFYSISILLCALTTELISEPSLTPINNYAILNQVAGIASTMIIVKAGLEGVNTESAEETVSYSLGSNLGQIANDVEMGKSESSVAQSAVGNVVDIGREE
ncbi:hypothetical protein K435DRAFT_838055 [Dendrothele bispora CBS 962.96]|uniref:G-protein coupled receptors family 1 profile domain-containing protein n=1 Tax=Dendrothele bispora (strain CBS 962.96) TaxID=1314807 RepID=A0A4S8M8G0_DENBC|nr:hypothetical protein K435DRAFT_838055 [Dendrothele bispora CBS 962.96]